MCAAMDELYERGIDFGRQEGIGIGRQEGRQERDMEIALKMLSMGKSVDEIKLITDLPHTEIEKLRVH